MSRRGAQSQSKEHKRENRMKRRTGTVKGLPGSGSQRPLKPLAEEPDPTNPEEWDGGSYFDNFVDGRGQ